VTLFNRLVIIVLAVVVLVGAVVTLLTTVGLIQPTQVAGAGSWFVDRLIPFAQQDAPTSAVTVGVCLVLILVAVLLLVLELRPGPREARRITLKEDAFGRVTVTLDGLRALADREAAAVAGVTRARSEVAQEPPGLRIACHVTVDPKSSVPELTETLRERLKSAVEHHVGLTVSHLSIDTRVASPVASSQRRRRVE
jgi:hypothetical protein